MTTSKIPLVFCGNHDYIEIDQDSIKSIPELISHFTGLHLTDFYLINNGKKFDLDTYTDGIIHVIPRIFGGKGGFGSMLRAIGAQIEKTTNREACRDLSGRRLRDINEERRLKNWLAQKDEREREAKERKRKKIERMLEEPVLKTELDKEYVQQRSDMTEKISDAVEQGFKLAASGTKRKSEEVHTANKKPKKGLLFDMDLDIDSDAEISSCESDDEVPGPSGVSSTSKSESAASSGNETNDNDESPGSSGIGTSKEDKSNVATVCASSK